MISYWMCPKERNTVRQLLLTLSIADCLIAVSYLGSSLWRVDLTIPGPDSTWTFNQSLCNIPMYNCVAQSYVMFTFFLVSYFYTVSIATYFYIVGVRGVHEGVHKRIVWVHIFCWVAPLCINFTALARGALGPGIWLSTGPWCWVDQCRLSPTEQIVWTTLTNHGWLIAAYVICPILYYFLWRDIKQQKRRMQRPFATHNERIGINEVTMFRAEDANFMYTPAVLYILRIWGTIRYIMSTIEVVQGGSLDSPAAVNNALFVLMCIGNNAQGFVNFILFCVCDATVLSKMLVSLCRYRPCKTFSVSSVSSLDSDQSTLLG